MTPGGVSSNAQRYAPRPLTDGERWTAQALITLRRRRYQPLAWVAFVDDALERSAAQRRARPEIARQARAWGAAGALAWLAACAATRAHPTLRFRQASGLLWWLAVWRMLDWHLGMAEGADGTPRERLSPADAITLARFWLTAAAVANARSPRGFPAVIVLGGLSDSLDGRVARRYGRTRLGRDLDTTADLAFAVAVALAARDTGRISPLGFTALTVRHTLGLALALGAAFARARRPAIRARPWGAALRIAGLAIGAAGARRTGTALLVSGSIIPPRSTAPRLPPA